MNFATSDLPRGLLGGSDLCHEALLLGLIACFYRTRIIPNQDGFDHVVIISRLKNPWFSLLRGLRAIATGDEAVPDPGVFRRGVSGKDQAYALRISALRSRRLIAACEQFGLLQCGDGEC